LISFKLSGRPENMVKNRFYGYIRRVYLGLENPYRIIPDQDTSSSSPIEKLEKIEERIEEF